MLLGLELKDTRRTVNCRGREQCRWGVTVPYNVMQGLSRLCELEKPPVTSSLIIKPISLRILFEMSTARSGSFQRVRKLLAVVLVLAVMGGPVRGSRFMKPTAYEVHHTEPSPPPPPPLRWWQHPPPPPLIIQRPPPIHHWYRQNPPSPPPPSSPPASAVNLNASSPPSPPPPLLSSPPPPPTRSQQSRPPPTSSPPPPPDGGRSKLWNGKGSQSGRRLFSSEDGADSGTNSFRVYDASPGRCSDEPAISPSSYGAPPLAPYGGYVVPVGAPYPSSDPGASSPVPSPAPTSGADGPTPESGDAGTVDNQCTYTIVTSTGNIDGAGTQADVTVEFSDKSGDSVLFVNLRSQDRNFDRGATDTFTAVGDCVQSICRMHLSHDDAGPSPGWFVNTVTVSLPSQTQVFNVFEWLAKDEPPYSLSRTISSCPV